MAADHGRLLQSFDVTNAVRRLGQEMERRAIMPDVTGPVGMPSGSVGRDPLNIPAILAKPGLRRHQRGFGKVQDGDISKAARDKAINQTRSAAADIDNCGNLLIPFGQIERLQREVESPFYPRHGGQRMAKRKRGNKLERWEIALIKAMLAKAGSNDQEILAYFTRPSRSINHRAISEIRTESKHKAIRAATEPDLDDFLATWPDVDPQTGLSLRGDELLIKAREAMIAAVHIFNGAGLMFRTELFIVTSIIAWTYLLHAWFRREGIDNRYVRPDGTIQKTKHGEDCYWELGRCLRHARCPVPKGAVINLDFLLGLRHEIEHRSTNRIDDAVSAKLQACCINFNDAIKASFGVQLA